ncbi:MAG TPA: GntR family transcriptional regulator, partial [Caulobacter sp.]
MATDPTAVQLANELADLIKRSGLKSGAVVASEQDLRARHDVGRSVLRQAARILEERGVAFMKRGAGGGLIVAPPDPEAAGRALAILLESRMQGPHALDRLLKATDTHVFLTATPRLDLIECERVRQLAIRLRRQTEAGLRPLGEIRQLLSAIRRLVKDPLAGLAYQTTAEYG